MYIFNSAYKPAQNWEENQHGTWNFDHKPICVRTFGNCQNLSSILVLVLDEPYFMFFLMVYETIMFGW